MMAALSLSQSQKMNESMYFVITFNSDDPGDQKVYSNGVELDGSFIKEPGFAITMEEILALYEAYRDSDKTPRKIGPFEVID